MRLIIVITICFVLRVNGNPIRVHFANGTESSLQNDPKLLERMMRVFAVVDSLTSLENYVELSQNRPLGQTRFEHNLKWEHMDLVHEFFEALEPKLRLGMRANLALLGSLDEALERHRAEYKSLRNSYGAFGADRYHEHLGRLAADYLALRWRRFKGPPELNPVRGGRFGALIDSLAGCEGLDCARGAELDELVRGARDEYSDELKGLVLNATSDSGDRYRTLWLIEDYFLQLTVRVLGEQVLAAGEADGARSCEKMRAQFASALKSLGFFVDSCLRLKRVEFQ